MKQKTIWLGALCAAMLWLGGCTTPSVEAVQAQTQTEMPPDATELGCVFCHTINRKAVGPAWKDVGQRYKDAEAFEYNGESYPLVEGMIMKVSQGGTGHWGMLPMPPADPTGDNRHKIEKLVRLALSLRRQ